MRFDTAIHDIVIYDIAVHDTDIMMPEGCAHGGSLSASLVTVSRVDCRP